MKAIDIFEFREDANELGFWIPYDFTCKMISHLRNKMIHAQIDISPMEENKTIRDRDRFYIFPIGAKERREQIKESINGFCERHGLSFPKWPSNF